VTAPLVVFATLEVAAFVLPLAAAAVALWIGRRHRARASDPAGDPHIATIEAATLGLLALLVAFALSMTEDRFDARRLLVVDEANAIGTAHLRTALLPAPVDADARRLLQAYGDARLEFYAARDQAAVERAEERAGALQASLWELAASAARERPTPTTALFVAAVNDVIDLDAKRLSAAEAHLPSTILVLLFVVAAVACAAVAYASAWSGRRSLLSLVMMPLLVGAALFVVVNLDRPRLGLIRVSDRALERLEESIRKAPAQP
jgi:hypothetical protein